MGAPAQRGLEVLPLRPLWGPVRPHAAPLWPVVHTSWPAVSPQAWPTPSRHAARGWVSEEPVCRWRAVGPGTDRLQAGRNAEDRNGQTPRDRALPPLPWGPFLAFLQPPVLSRGRHCLRRTPAL